MTDTPVHRIEPLLNVSDMAASLAFYVDGLGFRVTDRWQPDGVTRWCRLQLGDCTVMIQAMPKAGADAWKASGLPGDGVTLCMMCEDARKVYFGVTARGFEARRPFVGNGLWVTSLADPDGYRLDFESAADAPEGTVLP
ncbi:MAG: VOC family protein [Planctomycetes bacterium]|nr:VOC family protein [Planctomycetota bacterium]